MCVAARLPAVTGLMPVRIAPQENIFTDLPSIWSLHYPQLFRLFRCFKCRSEVWGGQTKWSPLPHLSSHFLTNLQLFISQQKKNNNKDLVVTSSSLSCAEGSRLLKSRSWSSICVLMFGATYSLSLTPLSSSDLLCGSLKHPLHLHISIRVMVRLLCVIRVENNINNNNKNNSSLWSGEESRRKVFDNAHQREMLK